MLELQGVCRHFPSGEGIVTVLKNIHLRIASGEMIAIKGPSGSGKSTLMNLLGCLDRPSEGTYLVAGQDTRTLSPDQLAHLRREYFGFIFQRYHLLPHLDALGNVEIPAIYKGEPSGQRQTRAQALLARLGLGQRMHHRPGQLSGGQQQRVSIARSLMNGGHIILADEPTGALDRQSGQEVMSILKTLHAEGHTVIIVTHDQEVASHAQRVIEMSEGEVVADEGKGACQAPLTWHAPSPQPSPASGRGSRSVTGEPTTKISWHRITTSLLEATKMAWFAMRSHRLRSFLTMLGIIIGIASVVCVVALGEGSRQQIIKQISFLGTNTITIYPGRGWGDNKAAAIRTLIPADVQALAQEAYADSVTPSVSASSTLRYRHHAVSASIQGVGEDYFRVFGKQIAEGRVFTSDSVRQQAQQVVIDHNTREKLFAAEENPLGKILMLGNVPAHIIGVLQKERSLFGAGNLTVFVPYTTASTRLLGQAHLQSIIVRVNDAVPSATAEMSIVRLLRARHGEQDFFIQNSDSIRQAFESSSRTMTLLISMIAAISLVVGGIGVMNIMLVSVTERITEIGVRMAVGARQYDILLQFLIESVFVCLLGGVLGIVTALGAGNVFSAVVSAERIQLVYSANSIIIACACSTLIGILFGFLPARNAARLDPVEALARD